MMDESIGSSASSWPGVMLFFGLAVIGGGSFAGVPVTRKLLGKGYCRGLEGMKRAQRLRRALWFTSVISTGHLDGSKG